MSIGFCFARLCLAVLFGLWASTSVRIIKNPLGEQQIMKILITGAFGNIGKAVIEEAHKRNHEVIVFEIDNKKTRKNAQKHRNKVKKVIFGDIRNFEDVKKAVQESEIVIHLAAIIPPTSKKIAS